MTLLIIILLIIVILQDTVNRNINEKIDDLEEKLGDKETTD